MKPPNPAVKLEAACLIQSLAVEPTPAALEWLADDAMWNIDTSRHKPAFVRALAAELRRQALVMRNT